MTNEQPRNNELSAITNTGSSVRSVVSMRSPAVLRRCNAGYFPESWFNEPYTVAINARRDLVPLEIQQSESSQVPDEAKGFEVPIQREGDFSNDTPMCDDQSTVPIESPFRAVRRKLEFDSPGDSFGWPTPPPFGHRVRQQAECPKPEVFRLHQRWPPCTRRGSKASRSTFEVPYQRRQEPVDIRRASSQVPTKTDEGAKEEEPIEQPLRTEAKADGSSSLGTSLWNIDPDSDDPASWFRDDEFPEDLDVFCQGQSSDVESFEICSSQDSSDSGDEYDY